MARRHSRSRGGGGSRRWAVFSLATLAVLAAAAWLAPRVLVLTGLRDRPLEAALAGIDGSVSSGGASWRWLGGIEYRDILLRDREGRAIVAVPLLIVDRGLAALALDPRDLGTVRLVGVEAVIDVRSGGSSLEDVIAPFLAARTAASGGGPACEVELAAATVELRDVVRGEAWRLTEVNAAGTVRPDGQPTAWTVAGRVQHAGGTAAAGAGVAVAATEQRLDRTTVAAAAAAALARAGGFSISCPAAAAATRTVTVASHRLPLGVSAVLATRLGGGWVCDGLADVRLDATVAADASRLAGTVAVQDLAVCRADSLAEVLTIDRCEAPVDCELRDGRVVVRQLAVSSPLFRAEASGRIRLPTGGAWDWAEGLIDEDFAIAADVDLAAAARALPGGLALRPDVRVTDGRLQVAAAAHADGDDRVLEVRVTSRDLAAVQTGAASGERPLRWTDPFTAFLKGRRRPGEGLRIEDARVASAAVELAASGDARAAAIQWTADLGRFAAEAAEVFDLGGARVAGDARGRFELVRADPAGPATLTVAASVAKLELTAPDRPAWKDEEITLEAAATGRLADGAALVDEARALVAAAGDRLEATLTGGVIVTCDGGVRLQAAAGKESIAADCSLAGDLGRWQPRLAAVWPAITTSGTWSGTVKSTAALAAQGAAWRVTRAGAEIEKLAIRAGDRRIDEPRVVATAAGIFHPGTGRIDVSSGEILSTTLSLRTGGLSWMPAAGDQPPDLPALAERLRGKAQWRAHAGRLASWVVPARTLAAWPVGGELSGMFEVADTAAGINLLVEMTGTQLSVARATAAGRAGGPAQTVWSEPEARLALEITRPAGTAGAEDLLVDRCGVESSTVAISARGRVQDWSGERLVELEGTAAYDWGQVSRLVEPWTGGRLKVAGSGARPFAFRGPLGGPARIQPAATTTTEPAIVPLPDEWLSAARGGDPDGRAARVARPVKATAPTPSLVSLVRGLAVDTTAAWTAAEIDGFALGGGEMPVRLLEGQLAFGPFDVAAAGGRLRGAPWIRLAPPAELIVPQGRMVDRVALSGPLCDRWVGWISPLLGHATHTRGVVTIDMAGARLPLTDPLAGELAARVIFDELEVTPAGATQPLVNLLAKLQAVVDPRFAFGDKLVLLRVRPDPVTIRLAEGRLWHEGLVMDSGQLVVRSRGSVATDGTLAMVVEVALRGDIAGQTPVVAQLLRTPLAIPLKGTVHRPQFDAQAIDVLLGRIVENTAQAVIQDGVVRGLESLETIFGNPPAAAPQANPAPPPLAFPAGR